MLLQELLQYPSCSNSCSNSGREVLGPPRKVIVLLRAPPPHVHQHISLAATWSAADSKKKWLFAEEMCNCILECEKLRPCCFEITVVSDCVFNLVNAPGGASSGSVEKHTSKIVDAMAESCGSLNVWHPVQSIATEAREWRAVWKDRLRRLQSCILHITQACHDRLDERVVASTEYTFDGVTRASCHCLLHAVKVYPLCVVWHCAALHGDGFRIGNL